VRLLTVSRLKSLEFDDACLCNSGAKTTANSIVYMWKKDV